MSRSRETYHHGDLKRALVDAALEVVDKEGPEALSFRRLADAVQVSHAAPLAHFPDRLSLDAAVASRGFQRLKAFLAAVPQGFPPAPPPQPPPQGHGQFMALHASPSAAAPQSAPASPGKPQAERPMLPSVARRLVAAALTYLRFALQYPGLYRVMYAPELSERLGQEVESAGEPGSAFDGLTREKAAVFATFVELIREGQQRGELRRETPPDQLARLFTALGEGLAQQFIAEKLSAQTERLQDAERMFELLVDAVGSRSS